MNLTTLLPTFKFLLKQHGAKIAIVARDEQPAAIGRLGQLAAGAEYELIETTAVVDGKEVHVLAAVPARSPITTSALAANPN